MTGVEIWGCVWSINSC